MRAVVVGVMGVGMLIGCTSAGVNLQRASARVIVPTPYPDSVVISDVHRGVTSAQWTATTREGVYDCSLEGSERVPICAKRAVPR
jgi:hypothetical protein